ncbi:uncharacterized protein DEA37_0009858 [Paragonimus westermani]|uniref:CCHC-type domain-containing protein n=1 Tax=Paragonimus westermani TaxID=34504 RepID=A0A5J4NAC7_9TREM|nr:uncharacterized protein DEA37_0009858 [Paragonimus westermani]
MTSSWHGAESDSSSPLTNINNGTVNLRKNSVRSGVSISSFKDESDSDGFTVNRQPDVETRFVTSDSSSVVSISSTCSSATLLLNKQSPSSHWDAADIVLGVADHSISSLCSLNDSAVIAERLSASSAPGHSKQECPLLDRLRHSVCNRCGLDGHQSHDCRCEPFRSNFIGHPPRRRVLVYDRMDVYRKQKKSALGARSQLAKSGKRKDVHKKKKKMLAPLTSATKHQAAMSVFEEIKSARESLSADASVEQVNERLLDQVIRQENRTGSFTPAAFGCGPSAEIPKSSSDRIRSRRSRPTVDDEEAAFLPLNPNSKNWRTIPNLSSKARNRRLRRSKSLHTSPSAFVWITERTAAGRLNEGTVPTAASTSSQNWDDPLCAPDKHSAPPLFDMQQRWRSRSRDFASSSIPAGRLFKKRRRMSMPTHFDAYDQPDAVIQPSRTSVDSVVTRAPIKRKKRSKQMPPASKKKLPVITDLFAVKKKRKDRKARETVRSSLKNARQQGAKKTDWLQFVRKLPIVDSWESPSRHTASERNSFERNFNNGKIRKQKHKLRKSSSFSEHVDL